MTQRPSWAPDEVDIERPAPARMYDYYLGGSHNFAADRELAEQAMAVWPDSPHIARANRAFLRRAIAFAVEQGVSQFLDLGAGIPTVGNTHEVAARLAPQARTVYVDNDLVAVAHSRSLLDGVANTMVVHADLRDADIVLEQARGMLDFSRPVAVLMFAVLHFVPDEDDPAAVVDAYRRATVPGSLLALTHATDDFQPERLRDMENVYRSASAGLTGRSHAQITALLPGYELVPPGLVCMIHWRPDPDAAPDPLNGDVSRYSAYAAVAVRT
ncbi:SAM-dependent methyltransferase [Actinocrinis sp.]|uniref:SAM-dependent methyltransferase n=1 Tax=Actinocrinis sp. TaxID=1920516 RepID=UPI002D3B46CA|nr:SAM-dependent methyltransferase [Actinocrinis sp.]HZP52211.1 SAM-dependent methyltransferase [Actinocrinis sp.]